MRLAKWVQNAQAELAAAGIQSARLEAQVLAAHVLGKDRSAILAHPEWEIDEHRANGFLRRRVNQEPLAYILGYREFYRRQFRVTKDVLIPRQETETLITAFLECSLPEDAHILDLGTGSGCIGISLKLERPTLRVTLADISRAALNIAIENAQRLGAAVEAVESDGFSGLAANKFHAIVTNPPYVAIADPLPQEVRDFEPHGALYAGTTGLEFYERLTKEAVVHLEPKGVLLTEVGDGQAAAVKHVFTSAGWTVGRSWRDLSGIERVVAAYRR